MAIAFNKTRAAVKRSARQRIQKHRRKERGFYDFNLLAVIILLICFGLVMLYSTSAYTSEINFHDDMYFFKRQSIISAGCIVMAVFISRFDYHILEKTATMLYIAAFVLMLLVKTSLGTESHGARRWIGVGSLTFQPAEIAKVAVIVCMSVMIVHMGSTIRTPKGMLILFAVGGIQALTAYIFTDNLSTAIIIFGITAGLIFIAHPDYKIFFILLGVAAFLGVILIWYINTKLGNSDSFRIQRIRVWLHPEDYAAGDGYQTLQALYAIGSGGIFGRGLGNSIQKLGSVPEAQNDFIFSIICEELGIAGALILLMLFGYLLYRLCFIAQNAPDRFGFLLVSGVFVHIALQVILNIAVVLNLLPNTGVTLPFISYGGTSVLFLMAEMGLVLSVARKIEFRNPGERLNDPLL